MILNGDKPGRVSRLHGLVVCVGGSQSGLAKGDWRRRSAGHNLSQGDNTSHSQEGEPTVPGVGCYRNYDHYIATKGKALSESEQVSAPLWCTSCLCAPATWLNIAKATDPCASCRYWTPPTKGFTPRPLVPRSACCSTPNLSPWLRLLWGLHLSVCSEPNY